LISNEKYQAVTAAWMRRQRTARCPLVILRTRQSWGLVLSGLAFAFTGGYWLLGWFPFCIPLALRGVTGLFPATTQM